MKTFQQLRRQSRARRMVAIKPAHGEANRAALQDALGYAVQAKLKVGAPDDAHEREADSVAERVMAMPQATVQRKCEHCEQEDEQKKDAEQSEPEKQDEEVQRKETGGEATLAPAGAAAIATSRGGGQPLPANERAFFEPRLGANLGPVRIHADEQAAPLSANLAARAFTAGSDVYFASGEYRPGSRQGRHLLAHELTHVVQQRDPGKRADIQRKLELRPPGKGEASAFGRAQELIDRLNTISPAIQYELKGRSLLYTLKDAAKLTHFDKKMKDFIDRDPLVPMRLITAKGYVGGGPLVADSFIAAYVDLDDLMADDLYSFQSDLLHFLTERFQVKGYDRKIGTALGGQFDKAHKAGKDAEAAFLQALFNDPSIVFLYEETKPNKTWVNAFKSKDHGYRVYQVVKNIGREVTGGEMWVQKKDGTRVSMDAFRKERAAAAP